MSWDIQVGPGACLELFDVAGTMAYSGRGRSAEWRVRIVLAEDATLRLSGEPFIVADGAQVRRSLTLDMAASAWALIRETLVLGRSGEEGGVLTNSSTVRIDGCPVWVEEQHLDPAGLRRLPGLLGDLRVLDTITALGRSAALVREAGQGHFVLPGGVGTVDRYLGEELSESPLHREWARLTGRRNPPLICPLCLGW